VNSVLASATYENHVENRTKGNKTIDTGGVENHVNTAARKSIATIGTGAFTKPPDFVFSKV